MGDEHWPKRLSSYSRLLWEWTCWLGAKGVEHFSDELWHWRSGQCWWHKGADGGGRVALWYTRSMGKKPCGCSWWLFPLLWTSGIPSVQEQWDWFHHGRCRVGSWSILSPVHMQRHEGKRDHSLFCSPGKWCPRHTSAQRARSYERRQMQQKTRELFCPCLWGCRRGGWLLSSWDRLQHTSSTPKFADYHSWSLTEPGWRWGNRNSTSLKIFAVLPLHKLTQIYFSRFMVKPIRAAQARPELFSASLIPWLVFLFPKFSAGHSPQVQRRMEEHIGSLLINSYILKLHRAIISQRCEQNGFASCELFSYLKHRISLK